MTEAKHKNMKLLSAVFASLLLLQTVIGKSIELAEDPYVEQGSLCLNLFDLRRDWLVGYVHL